MRLRFFRWMMGITAVSMAAVPTPGETTPAYRQADDERLGMLLQRLNMGELLETLARETENPSLELRSLQMMEGDLTAEQRDERMLSIAEKMKRQARTLDEQIKTFQAAGKDEQWEEAVIDYYNKQVKYIELMVSRRAKPLVDKFVFLLGSEEHRQRLRELTLPAMDDLAELERELTYRVERFREMSRTNPDKATLAVYLVPQLEEIANSLRYMSAYVRYYAALALTGTTDEEAREQRIDLLDDAAERIRPFTDTPMYGVMTPSRVLGGRIYRELEQYDLAVQNFMWAAGPNGDPAMLIEALFGLTRTYIAWGEHLMVDQEESAAGQDKFEQARQTIEDFVRRGLEQLGEENALNIDVKTLMLTYTLYDTWARALRSAGKNDLARSKDELAQKSFVDFLGKYDDPAIRGVLGQMVREKYADRDWKTLDPILVLLIGIGETNDAKATLRENPGDSDARATLDEAKQMFESIRRSDKATAKQAVPDALWYLSEIHIQQRNNFPAAEVCRELVQRFPDHERAFKAALRAVKINRLLIMYYMDDNPGLQIPVKRRKELIKSIELLLSHWPDRPEAAEYNFDLGYQYMKLSEIAEDPATKSQRIEKALSALRKVPESSVLHPEANFFRLQMRYQRTKALADPESKSVEALIEDLLAYGESTHRRRADAPTHPQDDGTPTRSDLGKWGSRSEYYARVLQYEKLDQQTPALAALENLPDRWPDTAVLQESKDFLIRKLLARGQVAEGVAEFKKFQEEYGQDATDALMRQVVATLKTTIDELAVEGKQPETLADFRRAYKEFGGQIYRTLDEDAGPQERYTITLLYAEALVQAGNEADARKALTLLSELEARDKKRRTQLAKEIERLVERGVKSVDAGSVPAAERSFARLKEALRENDLQDWDSYRVTEAKFALDKARDETIENPPVKVRLENTAEAIVQAYESMGRHLKDLISVDANIPYLQGKAYMLLGLYKQAFQKLRPLALGLTPQQSHEMYWDTQLMLMQASYRMNADDPKALQRLLLQLQQLRMNDPQLGGERFRGRFNRIQADIENKTKQA